MKKKLLSDLALLFIVGALSGCIVEGHWPHWHGGYHHGGEGGHGHEGGHRGHHD